ncbi:hypothetical protein L3Q82_019613, partial [Scortum barcoo]
YLKLCDNFSQILSRVKPAVGTETPVSISDKKKKNKTKVPGLEDYLQQRDYLGALTLLEFQRSIGEKEEHADLWIGYCAFHLGDYKRAMEEYKSLTMKPECPPDVWVYLACALFFLGLYKEAEEAASKAPMSPLQNRLLFHLAHKFNDEKKLMGFHQNLEDVTEDQLSLASIHYMRSHYQEAIDIYKRLLLQNSWNTLSTTPVCHSRGTVPNLHAMLQRRVSQDSPTTSRDLRYSGRISSTPGALPLQELANYLSDFGLGDGRVHLRVPSPRFLIGRQVGGIEVILKVFLPPSDNVPIVDGQQLPTRTVNSVGRVLLPLLLRRLEDRPKAAAQAILPAVPINCVGSRSSKKAWYSVLLFGPFRLRHKQQQETYSQPEGMTGKRPLSFTGVNSNTWRLSWGAISKPTHQPAAAHPGQLQSSGGQSSPSQGAGFQSPSYAWRDFLALKVYVALCYYKLDYYDVSQEVLAVYLQSMPDSTIALNLKACNHFRLYNGKAAEAALKNLIDISSCSFEFAKELIRHNLVSSSQARTVVFRGGEGALQVLPPLIDVIPEARLNLVIYYLRQDDVQEAYNLIQDAVPTTPQEYILKGVVNAALGQEIGSRDHLKIAQQFFQLVGGSASECDTIPGRQCMASCFFLLRQFEDVLIYLNSVKVSAAQCQGYFYNDDTFNFNYAQAKAALGNYKEAEEVFLLIQSEKIKNDYVYLSWLARCYIMNQRGRLAWELYLKMGTSSDSFSLLQLIANDCYKMGQFYYAAKAFDALEKLDPGSNYWEGKRGACVGVFQLILANKESKETLKEIVPLLQNTGNPQQIEDASSCRENNFSATVAAPGVHFVWCGGGPDVRVGTEQPPELRETFFNPPIWSSFAK